MPESNLEIVLVIMVVALAVTIVAAGVYYLFGRESSPRRDARPLEIQEYEVWTGDEDRRQSVALATEIKNAQETAVRLQGQHLHAVRELRRLMSVGGNTGPQRIIVDTIARRLQAAEEHVAEMRIYVRFFHRDYFLR